MSDKSLLRKNSFFSLLLALMLLLPVLVGAAAAAAAPAGQESGPLPQHNDPFWSAQYWNNASLSGQPLVTGADASINFNWGNGSPNSAIGVDNFSARWTRYLSLDAATYRFTARTDDGVRVWLDDALIIDRWSEHPAQSFSAEKSVSAGHHLVRVEYYESGGLAEASFNYEVVSQPINAWRGEYFNNTNLSGNPVLVRDDANVDFNWGLNAPASGVQADNFSARWTRTLNFAAGNYRFTTSSDDGVRLWVNGHLLIDKWVNQAVASYNGTIYLNGNAPVKLEYFDGRDHAVAKLSWTRTDGGTPPPAGGIVVDDKDAGFVKGGSSSSWRTADEGYNSRLTWTKNNDTPRSNYNWARWYPELSAGRYEVFVYIPFRYTTTSSARYWVAHRDGYTLKVVDQSANGDEWVSLGTYNFQGNNSDYVSLSDVTGESYLSRLIAFDAMKWVAR